jgi:nicotinate-nucleotide adenylyltransferase
VVSRGGAADVDPGPPWRVKHVRIPALEISSSELRARAAAGQPLDHLVPLAAIACMRERGLYAGGT